MSIAEEAPSVTSQEIIEAVRIAKQAGLTVLPAAQDGTKMPAVPSWKGFQSRHPTSSELKLWFADQLQTGLGYVTGNHSGLGCLEFDDADVYQAYLALSEASGLGELVARVMDGFSDGTPRGGIHGYYRCSEIGGNTKLAERPGPSEGSRETLAETRGEGGWAVAFPSHGTVHPTRKPYTRRSGGPASIATITPDEQHELFQLARLLDEMPKKEHREPKAAQADKQRVGDVYAEAEDWRNILEPHGWTEVFTRNGVTYWRRPGKDRGISATTNHGGHDALYVFTSSTIFEPSTGYRKLTAYVLLNHAGDWKAAVRELVRLGYAPPEEETPETEEVSIPEAPGFARTILPDHWERYARANAVSMGVPVEMIILPMLANAGSFLGNRLGLQLKKGYIIFPGLWVATVAPPGTAKTPVQNTARRILDALQDDWYDGYQKALANYEVELERWGEKPKCDRGPKPIRPTLRSAFSTDATTEAVAHMLQATYGLSLQFDELVSFIRSQDQYRQGKGADRQKYLSFWAAVSTKVDRRTGEPIYVKRPVVSVVGGIQPDMLAELRDKNGREDGFIDRFVIIRPDVRRPDWTEDEADPALLAPLIEDLNTLDKALGPLIDREYRTVQLHPDARSRWIAWYNANSQRVREATGLRAGVLSKLDSQVARIALILNALKNPDDPERLVSADVMDDAIWLGEFCLTHWDRVFPLIGQATSKASDTLPDRVLRILNDPADQDGDGWVARGRILNRLRNVTPAVLTASLSALQSDNLAESRMVATVTKPREEWRAIAESKSSPGKAESDNSDYSPPPQPASRKADSDNSENPRDPKITNLDDHRRAPLDPTGTDDDWLVF